ncbi:peptidoglycan/LPS O-acetylase OafA/YrhL [Luteibacter jiangsuensis]|uniref:Peptidoglycan/LPS O-acetylase OafA/YrhL n=1 Tax=Luteibacter jiangsuensis TaxID=637577 RepID=A0ABT9SZY4_9GAMM|nr:acyltransferase [Luteibacter jiangsuensis]MDQ0010575.1 peptidoglycan/LPS O-acetylase OafA/YrhL [Luteibacter jiangsuensis]
MSSASLPRSPGIDTLRGASILLVVIHHLGLRLPLHKTDAADWLPAPFLKGLIQNGYEAVFIFFVISGFLITRHALERDGPLREIDWRAFYVRRIARIVPCLLGIVLILLACHALRLPNYTIDRAGQSPWAATLSALTFTLNLYEGRTGWLPGGWDVLWSLSIEEVFYLGFPLVCLSLGRTRWLVPSLLLLVLSVPFARAAIVDNEIWQEKAYLPGMGAIAAGVLAALAVGAGPARSFAGRGRRALLAVVGLVSLSLVMFSGGWLWRAIHEGYMLVLIGASVCLVLASPEGGRAWPGFGWLRAMGRASYEIYLTHMFIVFSLVGCARATGTDTVDGWIWYVPAVLGSWALGWLVARFFSEPANRWLRSRFHAGEAREPVVEAA